mmetsp:Transcript_19084/g.21593  ORF Transcript_19084/g.21593 Transcript_19084/m.21593 type:complete len:468 (-) Transcript_19084:42-1445(-)
MSAMNTDTTYTRVDHHLEKYLDIKMVLKRMQGLGFFARFQDLLHQYAISEVKNLADYDFGGRQYRISLETKSSALGIKENIKLITNSLVNEVWDNAFALREARESVISAESFQTTQTPRSSAKKSQKAGTGNGEDQSFRGSGTSTGAGDQRPQRSHTANPVEYKSVQHQSFTTSGESNRMRRSSDQNTSEVPNRYEVHDKVAGRKRVDEDFCNPKSLSPEVKILDSQQRKVVSSGQLFGQQQQYQVKSSQSLLQGQGQGHGYGERESGTIIHGKNLNETDTNVQYRSQPDLFNGSAEKSKRSIKEASGRYGTIHSDKFQISPSRRVGDNLRYSPMKNSTPSKKGTPSRKKRSEFSPGATSYTEDRESSFNKSRGISGSSPRRGEPSVYSEFNYVAGPATFSREKRELTLGNRETPGPGRYEKPTSLKTESQQTFNRAERKEFALDSQGGSPGPGKYTPQLHYVSRQY